MVTQKRLRELFNYDEDTGLFTRISPVRKANVGDIAGCVAKNGYITISVDCKRYYAHRLAFIYMTGSCPRTVDHIDRDRSNNKWSNLRESTAQLQEANKVKCQGKTSKYKGVSFKSKIGRYVARLKVDGNEIYLGCFADEDNAARAYNAAAVEAFGKYAVINNV